MADSLWTLVLLPLGLGLLGFIEPCSIGTSLLFIRYVEDRPAAAKIAQAVVFTLTRALFIGLLGLLAALVGGAFIALQKAGWVVLGGLYILLGLLYLAGRAGSLMRSLGPGLSRLSETKGAAALAVLFGLNIPACAAPLLAILLGTAAMTGGAKLAAGFLMLAVFGLALSLPLLLALLWAPARRLLDRLSQGARRVPVPIGLLFIALGAWSIYFGAVSNYGL